MSVGKSAGNVYNELRIGNQVNGWGLACRWWHSDFDWGTWYTGNLRAVNLGKLEVVLVCPR